MKLHAMVDESRKAFLHYAPTAKVIMLHPYSRYRSILISTLLSDEALTTLYYPMGPDDVTVKAFLTGLTHDLALQAPSFGHHLNLVDRNDSGDATEQWLTAMVNDLNTWSTDPYYLIIDEYDRSDSADDIQEFMMALISRLPEQCTLVFNSRTLPRLPWVSLIARGEAVILEDADILTANFYRFGQHEEGVQLDVTALGPGYVSLDGKLISSWEGHLPRLLFFFALDRPTVTRSEICQAFWPELEVEQAVNVFHVTKRRLHKALKADVLVHENGYYYINPELSISYDVVEFVGALATARAADETERLQYWQKAIELYRGPFLQSHDESWIVERRVDFLAGYMEAIAAIAENRYENGAVEVALRLYTRASGEDITREDIHRRIMQLYAEMGRRSEAAAHYQNVQREFGAMQRELSEETVALYSQIMS